MTPGILPDNLSMMKGLTAGRLAADAGLEAKARGD
jgi:hypothetical protein